MQMRSKSYGMRRAPGVGEAQPLQWVRPIHVREVTMSEKPLKSAFDLAMDRLKAKDVAEGVEEAAPLSKAQKNRIAELRTEAQAKLAELEILHRKNVAGTSDPAALVKIEENYAIDRGRAESRRDAEIEKVRKGKS